MSFVLDASVALAWCFSDEETPQSISLLEKLEAEKAFVPSIWPLEISNILVSAERRKRISFAKITQFLELIQNLPIKIDNETCSRAFHETFSLAYTKQLTTYDASYLELAMRLGMPLATKDIQLLKVAKNLGVKVIAV